MTVSGFSFLALVVNPFKNVASAASAPVAGSVAASSAASPPIPLEMGCCSTMSAAPSPCQSKCIAYAAALVAGGAIIGYFVGKTLTARSARCNTKVHLECDKVADSIDIEDIGEKKAFCRCWKSEKWPYCDGTHNKHNKETGDNVGPLIVKGKAPQQQQ